MQLRSQSRWLRAHQRLITLGQLDEPLKRGWVLPEGGASKPERDSAVGLAGQAVWGGRDSKALRGPPDTERSLQTTANKIIGTSTLRPREAELCRPPREHERNRRRSEPSRDLHFSLGAAEYRIHCAKPISIMFDPWNCEIINLRCLKSLSLW